MTPITVVGMGLGGTNGLPPQEQSLPETATLLVGSPRYLAFFPPGPRLPLGDLGTALKTIRSHLESHPTPRVVILTSGDPLFYGLGRLLLQEFPPPWLTFYPHPSAVQILFNRIKVPWQDARVVSVHGRSLEVLTQVLHQGAAKIAVLTDHCHTPRAIATHLLSLDLPVNYQAWVGEELGGPAEQVYTLSLTELAHTDTAPLNVLVLLRSETAIALPPLPRLGIPDHLWVSFPDQPGLITKREVRVLALAELALGSNQVVWDIGAGTGSVGIEVARLCPSSQVWAVEKSALGVSTLGQNRDRFGVTNNLQVVHGEAPESLGELPDPDRVFIGGSSERLVEVLEVVRGRLRPEGVVVLALATVEHLYTVHQWAQGQARLLQVQVSRSAPVGPLTRWSPLNPVTLVTLLGLKAVEEGEGGNRQL